MSREQELSVKGSTQVRALVPMHEPDKLARGLDSLEEISGIE